MTLPGERDAAIPVGHFALLTSLELVSIQIHFQPSFAHDYGDVLPDTGLQDVREVVLARSEDDSQAQVRPAVDQETVSLSGGELVEDAAGLAFCGLNPCLERDRSR